MDYILQGKILTAEHHRVCGSCLLFPHECKHAIESARNRSCLGYDGMFWVDPRPREEINIIEFI